MSEFEFRSYIKKLNEAAHSHLIGGLQDIRAELHNKQRSGEKIFNLKYITDSYAFHYGGRKELQFNVAIDGLDDDQLRSGVAFSFETNQTLPEIGVLIPKVKLFNDFLRFNPHIYSDMRMWHWRKAKRREENPPGPIPSELIVEGVFLFLEI